MPGFQRVDLVLGGGRFPPEVWAEIRWQREEGAIVVLLGRAHRGWVDRCPPGFQDAAVNSDGVEVFCQRCGLGYGDEQKRHSWLF